MVRKCIICNSPQKTGGPLSFYKFPSHEDRRRVWIKACKLEENDIHTSSLICSKHFIEDDFDSTFITNRILLPNAIPSPSLNYSRMKTNTRQSPKVKVRQNVKNCPLLDDSEMSLQSGNILKELTTGASKETVNPFTTEAIEKGLMEGSIFNDFDHTYCADADVQNGELQISTGVDMQNDSNKILRYIGDLQPEHFGSPKSAKKNLEFIKKSVGEQRKIIKVLEAQNKRLELRFEKINELMVNLKEQNLLSEEAFRIYTHTNN